ncbi:hypothetical protein EJB05_14141, partial [Eragrostis curvula]
MEKFSKMETLNLENQSLHNLKRLLLRASIIIEEAEGRLITNKGMVHQLNLLRKEMYRGYFIMDYLRSQEIEVKGHDVSSSFVISKFNYAKRIFYTTTDTDKKKDLEHTLNNLNTLIEDVKGLLVYLKNYPPLYRQPYSMHLFIGKCMFGRQMEMERVMEFLIQQEHPGTESVGVLPIVGPTWVGKSTLVAHVCKDARVQVYFSRVVTIRGDSVNSDNLATLKEDMGLIMHQNSSLGKNERVLDLINKCVPTAAWMGNDELFVLDKYRTYSTEENAPVITMEDVVSGNSTAEDKVQRKRKLNDKFENKIYTRATLLSSISISDNPMPDRIVTLASQRQSQRRLVGLLYSKMEDTRFNDLERLLRRAHTIINEAEGRLITNRAMVYQLNILRKEMYRGYFTMDRLKKESNDAKGHDVSHSCPLSNLMNATKRISVLTDDTHRKNEVEQLICNLNEIISDANELVIFLGNHPPMYRQPYNMHLTIGKCMFGRHMEMDRIMDFLMQKEHQSNRNVGILPITGPGYVGKSTLMAHICNDTRVRNHFSRIVIVNGDVINGKMLNVVNDGFFKENIQRNVSLFGEHPYELMQKQKPACYLINNDRYMVCAEYLAYRDGENVPSITMRDVVSGNVKCEGAFKVLALKSQVLPLLSPALLELEQYHVVKHRVLVLNGHLPPRRDGGALGPDGGGATAMPSANSVALRSPRPRVLCSSAPPLMSLPESPPPRRLVAVLGEGGGAARVLEIAERAALALQ